VPHCQALPGRGALHPDLEETTDVSNCSQLIALVRSAHDDGTTKENFLFCGEWKITTIPKGVFPFVKNFSKHELHTRSIGSVYVDVAPALLGYKSGFFLH